MKSTKLFLALGGAVALSAPAGATSLFSASTSITDPVLGTTTLAASFSSVENVINYYKSANIDTVAPAYQNAYNNGLDTLSASLTYMGTTASITALPVTNGVATVTFTVPGAGITLTGTGATRDIAVDNLKSQLTGNGGTLLNTLQAYLTTSSPVSPLAGNPNSLQGTLSASSFANSGFNTSDNASSDPNAPSNRFGLSVSAGQFSSGGFNGTVYSIPISYSHRFTQSGWALEFSLPLTYEDVGGAVSYSAQTALGLQIPVHPGIDWYITPMVSAGVAASLDFGSAGAMYSYTLTSRYTYHATSSLDLTLGNMVGEIQTLGLKVKNYDIDPKVSDRVFKNGVMAEYVTPYSFLGEPFSLRGGYALTNYAGSKLYMNEYHEVFFDIGAASSSTGPFYKRVRLGVQSTFGRHYSSINGGLGYSF